MTFATHSGWVFGSNADASSTMKKMASRVRDCVRNSRDVIDTANMIVASVTPRDKRMQIRAITDWLLHRFRFVSDPVNVELLRDPAGSIAAMRKNGYTQGDCDEAAMFAAALGLANGIAARFRALAFGTIDAPYSHVIADLQDQFGTWVPVDITRPQGFTPPPVSRTLTQMV